MVRELKFAHYRNRFCMFRTYYALASGSIKPDGFNLEVIEVADPPSHAQEEAIIAGDVQVANLYLPNFLRRKIEGAPIVGLATEWKSTARGNGIFVRADGPVRTPGDLGGRLIATHQGAHANHRYLLWHRYGVNDKTLRWESYPQEELLGVLKSGKVDAVVLIDQFFFLGERDREIRCLYTDGEAWRALTGFSEIIKHMIVAREDLIREHPELREKLLQTFRASFAYSGSRLDEIADRFMERYGGVKQALLASARYPKIEFTFTETERKLAAAQMDLLVETGELPRKVPLSSAFAA